MTDHRSGTDKGTESTFTQLSGGAPTLQDASSTLASAKDAAGDIAAKASDQASTFVDQVREKAASALSDQKDGLADRIV